MKIKFFVILSAILLISCSRESAVQFSHPFLEVENNNQSENWYDIPGMICRDGSPTGIGYRVGNPKKLAIYINGGGACFNEPTCAGNHLTVQICKICIHNMETAEFLTHLIQKIH